MRIGSCVPAFFSVLAALALALGCAQGAVAFSNIFWKKLTPAQQAIVQAAASEGIKMQDKLIAEGDEEAMKKAVAAGAKYHKVDKAPWQKSMLPIYGTWASKVGGMETIKAVQDTP